MYLFVRELGVIPKCSICSNEILKTTEFSPPTNRRAGYQPLGLSLSPSMSHWLDIDTKYVLMYTYVASCCSFRWIWLFGSVTRDTLRSSEQRSDDEIVKVRLIGVRMVADGSAMSPNDLLNYSYCYQAMRLIWARSLAVDRHPRLGYMVVLV